MVWNGGVAELRIHGEDELVGTRKLDTLGDVIYQRRYNIGIVYYGTYTDIQ